MPLKTHHLAPVAMRFEKGLQIFLGPAGLGEDQRFALRRPLSAICSKPMSSALSSVCVLVSMPMPRAQSASCCRSSISSRSFCRSIVRGRFRRRQTSSSSARISSSRSSSISSASISRSANSGSSCDLLVAEGFQPRPERVERGGDGLRGRGEQLAQDQGGQVALPLRERIAVRPLQEGGHRLVERVLVVGRLERARDRAAVRCSGCIR